jgi:replicative DNA helicase
MIYDERIEKAVLGSILLEGKTYFKVADRIPDGSFHLEHHQFIWDCIQQVAETSQIDILTVSHKCLELKGSLDKRYAEFNWPYEISNLTSQIASTHHLEQHVEILLFFRTKRNIYKMAQETIRGIEDGTELTDVIENAADLFVDATSNTKNTEVRIDEGLKEFVLNQHKDLADKLIPTYLPEIDKIIGGFEYSDLIIIAGAASMGKTSFMLRLLQNYLNQDKSIAIFSLEMSNNQLLTRVISMETGVPVKNIRYNNLDDSDWDSIHKTIGKYENKRFIMDGQTTKLTDVLTKIKKLKIKEDVDIIFIDYLQLIVDGKSKGSREQEVAKIARSLKNIAKELNIVVVALSQLSRALMQRDNKRPMLSDLRESGEIEQAADTIMFAFREEYYTMENPRDIQDAEIIIAKGRNVGTGTAYMKFKPANVKFISPEADGYELMEAENNVF